MIRIIIVLLLSSSILKLSGQEVGIGEKICFTQEIKANNVTPQVFPLVTILRKSLRNGTWNVNDGYGTTCTHDCTLAGSASCSKFRIPVVFTVSTSSGCGTTIPTQSNIDAQINITNDFFACQSIPIELYKSISYDGHPSTGDMSTRFQNIGCSYSASVLNDVPEVLNIYIFSNTNYGTGANGWAYMPLSSSAPLEVIISRNAFNGFGYTLGSLNCTNPTLGLSVVIIHELGHILGLHHTHNESNATKECPDMSNNCDGGDYISDTDADPGLHLSCASGSGCDKSPNNCTSPCATPYPSNINTEANIMSYNNDANCRKFFTSCQKAKIVDALLCARGPQMCDRNIDNEFQNGYSDTYKEICIGDPPPTFTASTSCYSWYAVLGTASPLSEGTSSFTPTLGTGIGQLNNNVSGTYYWYLGDQNEINPECRTQLTIRVLSDIGTPSVGGASTFTSSSCTSSNIADLTTTTVALGSDEIIGWWITEDEPITMSVVDESSLTSALSNATLNSPLSNPVNHLIQSTTGTPLKNLALSFDCGILNKEKNYYATPFLAHYASAVPEQVFNCTNKPALCGNSIGINFGCGYLSGGYFTTGAITGLPSNPINPAQYTIQITGINYPTNCTPNNMLLDVRDAVTQASLLLTLPGNVTSISLSQANFPNYNLGNGFIILLYDQSTGTCCSGAPAIINFSVNISITYPSVPAIPFPSVTGYEACYFGESIALNCSCNCLPQAIITSSDNVICQGQSSILSVSPSGNYSYEWNNSQSGISQTVSPAATETYTVTVSHNVLECNSMDEETIYVESSLQVTNGGNSGLGSLRQILECAENGDTLTFLPGLNVMMTDSLGIRKDINLFGDASNPPHIHVNTTDLYGWHIDPNKILSLQDIMIHVSGASSASLHNDGTLNLMHTDIEGNTVPVIQNNGHINILGTPASSIKRP